MMGDDKSGIVGLLGIAVCVAGVFVLRKMFPALAVALLSGAILIVLLLIAVVVLVIVWAFRKPEDKEGSSVEQEIISLQKEGRRILLEIRQISMRLKDCEIRKRSDEICDTAGKIIAEMKNYQGSFTNIRKFFDYYLPTFGKILKNYENLESAGVVKEETTKSTIQCLEEIQIAMDKQYQNLFEKLELDLTVEMEVLSMICRRDGLIQEEDKI